MPNGLSTHSFSLGSRKRGFISWQAIRPLTIRKSQSPSSFFYFFFLSILRWLPLKEANTRWNVFSLPLAVSFMTLLGYSQKGLPSSSSPSLPFCTMHCPTTQHWAIDNKETTKKTKRVKWWVRGRRSSLRSERERLSFYDFRPTQSLFTIKYQQRAS